MRFDNLLIVSLLLSLNVAVIGTSNPPQKRQRPSHTSRGDRWRRSVELQALAELDGHEVQPLNFHELLSHARKPVQGAFHRRSLEDLFNIEILMPRDDAPMGVKGVWDSLSGLLGGSSKDSEEQTNSKNQNDNDSGVENALGPGQDPSPISRIESDGQRHYYFPTTDFNRGVYMQYSTNLNYVLSDSSNEKQIYSYDAQVGPEAPGFLQWDANTYILYISSVGPQGNGTLRALLNTGGDNLLDGWKDIGEIRQKSGKKLVYYDGYAFNHPNGKHYL